MTEKRISTPVVLAVSSAMLAVALVAWASIDDSAPSDPDPATFDPDALQIDDSTPERAATSFYDAWRRRRWEPALTLAVDDARTAVLNKQARDEAMPRDERIVAERTWDALAHAPLTLVLDEAEMLEGDRTRLSGIAEYTFVGQPYRRRVSFLVVPSSPRHYRVAEMALGDVLTELPTVFRGDAP